MKRTFLVLAILFFSTADSLPAYGDTLDQSRQWQPISEITDFECGIIQNASKKTCAITIENADAFVLQKNLVIVRFQNGDEGYYGYGGGGLASKTAIGDESDGDIYGKAIRTYNQFIKVWRERTGRVNELTPEELAEADGLMQTYFSLVQQLPDEMKKNELAFNTSPIATLGNRYASQFENLFSSASTYTRANFYDFYIYWAEDSDNRSMRDEDKPNEQDKRLALQKLADILLNWQGQEFPFTIMSATRDFFEKNDPVTLHSLIKQKKISP